MEMSSALQVLRSLNWSIQTQGTQFDLPPVLRQRYDWVPDEIKSFVCSIFSASTCDDKTWFVSYVELNDESDSAFRWNQWELDSLEAAAGNRSWQSRISEFWDDHFPFLMSVRNEYKYVAVRKADSFIVGGREPEFEQTVPVSSSFSELFEKIRDGDSIAEEFM